MTETKEVFYSILKENLYGKVDLKAIPTIIEAVVVSLENFSLEKVTRDIVLYDHGTEKLISKFLVSKAVEGLTDKSLATYRNVLEMFFDKTFKEVEEVSTDDIRIFLAYKKMEHASGNYLNLIRRTLNSFYSWCQDEGLIAVNPVKRINCIRVEKKVRKPFTEDEMEILRTSAKTLRDKAIIEFLYSTGCRVSEMCGLDRSEIDFEQGVASVLGKGKKYRDVYLSARCKIVLLEYLNSREDNLDCLFESKPMIPAGNTEHSRITASGVETMLRKLGKKCGVENVHPHRFRRTAATLALKRGMTIEQVQKVLGHESIATTTIYAQSNNDDVKLAHSKYII